MSSLTKIYDCYLVSHKPLTRLLLTHFQFDHQKQSYVILNEREMQPKILYAKCCSFFWCHNRSTMNRFHVRWGAQMAICVNRFVINLHVYIQSVCQWIVNLFHCPSVADSWPISYTMFDMLICWWFSAGKRQNSGALSMELCLSCTKPSMWWRLSVQDQWKC